MEKNVYKRCIKNVDAFVHGVVSCIAYSVILTVIKN